MFYSLKMLAFHPTIFHIWFLKNLKSVQLGFANISCYSSVRKWSPFWRIQVVCVYTLICLILWYKSSTGLVQKIKWSKIVHRYCSVFLVHQNGRKKIMYVHCIQLLIILLAPGDWNLGSIRNELRVANPPNGVFYDTSDPILAFHVQLLEFISHILL